MAKLKFNMNFGGEQVRTLDDLRENFSIEDVLDNYNNGTLARWLDCRSYTNELEQVKAIMATDARGILAELIRIFSVASDPAEVEADLSLIDYLEGRKKFWEDIKANGLDGIDTIRALKQERDYLKGKLEKLEQERNNIIPKEIPLKDGSIGIKAEIPVGHLVDDGWITIESEEDSIFKIVEIGNCASLIVADADDRHRNIQYTVKSAVENGNLFEGIAVCAGGTEALNYFKSLNKQTPLYFYYKEI